MRRFEVLELPQNDLRVVLMDAELDDRARRPESHGRELLRVQQLLQRFDTLAGQSLHASHPGSVEGLPSMVVLRQERCVFRQPAAERALVDPAPLRGALDRRTD
jgi:hypothetical protein